MCWIKLKINDKIKISIFSTMVQVIQLQFVYNVKL